MDRRRRAWLAQIENPQRVGTGLPEGAAERKALPVVTGVLDYFPLAIAYLAEISQAGNDQHNPGEPLHWSRDKSTDHADCIGRHLLERGTMDGELRHTGKLAWRALALLQQELEVEQGFYPLEEEEPPLSVGHSPAWAVGSGPT